MNTWSDIAIFLAVMQHGSAAAAARVLRTNQTTVSRRIERLEASLGLKLFEPGPRGAQPTEGARRLLPDAEAVALAAKSFEQTAQDITRRLSGTIRLSAHPSAVRYASGLILQFERLHPGARVIVDAESRTVSLEDGEADVAIRPGDRLKGDTLVARKLFRHPWAFYAAQDYLDRKGRPTGFADLDGHSVLRLTGDFSEMEPIRSAQARLPDGVVSVPTGSVYNVVGLARAGEGLGFMPRAEGDMDQTLVFCFSEPDLFQTHWLVTTDVGHASPLIRAFFRFCGTEVPRFLATLPPEWTI